MITDLKIKDEFTNVLKNLDSPYFPFINTFFLDNLPYSLTKNRETFPRYDLIKLNSNEFLIELCVAGFDKKDLKIYTKDNTLYVESHANDQRKVEYLYKGITSKNFKWQLELPHLYKIKDISLINGILKIQVCLENDQTTEKVYTIR